MDNRVYFVLLLLSIVASTWGGVRFVLWMDRVGEASLQRIIEAAMAHAATDPSPIVDLSFCTYRTCIAFWSQTQHRISLPYDTASILLKDLHHYTLRWGWLGPAMILLPWSFLLYAFERWRLRRQLRNATEAGRGP